MPGLSWRNAIAYLKPRLPDGLDEPVLALTQEESPVLRDLGNGLLVAYLIDEGDQFSYVQNEDLSATGASEAKLHQCAIHNLYDLADNKGVRVQPYGSIFAMFLDGNFERSLLLLDTLWDQSLAEHVPDGAVVAAPTRDVLAFGNRATPGVMEELRAVVDRVSENCDCPAPFLERRDQAWVQRDT